MKKQPKAIIEYRVRATGTSSNRISGPFKDPEKARKSLERNTQDWQEVAGINAYYANIGPFVLEARYVGPWESVEDVETRAEVIADNTEWTTA